MFQMDTRFKQTPLPIPSLSFLTKNFSDGTHETETHPSIAPSFDTLGLQNAPSTEPTKPPSTKFRLQATAKTQKVREIIFSFHIYPNY